MSSEGGTGSPPVNAGEVRLEVVVVPLSDVDRAICRSLECRLRRIRADAGGRRKSPV
jgi:hypothetical protein